MPVARPPMLLCLSAIVILSLFACSEPVRQADIPETAAPPAADLVFDLNTVSLEELLAAAGRIYGLDRAVARNIVEFRKRFRYERIEDLLAVPEIGEKTFLKIRRHFKVTGASRAD